MSQTARSTQSRKRSLLGVLAVVAGLITSNGCVAHADPGRVFTGGPNPITCQAQADGVRYCKGDASHLIPSWDGTPIDVTVTLPPRPRTGPDGPYPLLGFFHGWGLAKFDPAGTGAGRTMDRWAREGVAGFTMSDRGFGASCGGGTAHLLTTAQQEQCLKTGYPHFLDLRYEVRDAQYLMGRLVDQQNTRGTHLIDGQRIGATGASYGGGMSMALASLKDRMMLPDGGLAPWTSPGGQRMRLAAAAPEVPWTDMAYALLPTGRDLDYATDPHRQAGVGVLKASFFANLWSFGAQTTHYAIPATDPDADLLTWAARLAAGDPYEDDPQTQQMLTELQQHHSSYFVDHSEQPAPLLIANGFADDIFPVDEALRFYNRTMRQYPKAFVGMEFLDFGHQRAQSRAADTNRLAARQRSFMEHFLLGQGGTPDRGVSVMTQVCDTIAPAPLYTASTWAGLQHGEVRLVDSSTQAITAPGSAQEGYTFDPIVGANACGQASDAGDQTGVGTYRIPVTGSGFTMLGSATILAQLQSTSPEAQLAYRVLDVDASGQERLVARGLYRPGLAVQPTAALFQSHPGAYFFAPKHTLKLQLMPYDAPYSRPSNAQGTVIISHLELRIPTHDAPGGKQVLAPAPKVVPSGTVPAPGQPTARTSTAAPPESGAPLVPTVPGPLPTAQVWLTTPDGTAKLSPLGAIPFRGGGQYDTSGGPIPGAGTLPPITGAVPTGIVDGPTIEIDPTRSYQTMSGFGAAITDSSAAVLSSLSAPVREATMRSLFDPTVGDGLSYLRQPFGGSDFVASRAYTYDDVPRGKTDYSLAHFSIAHDLSQIVPLVVQARQLNPQLGVVATPWSPPAWMKTTNSLVGGRLIDSPRIYKAYAAYLVKALKAYKSAGVPVDTITVQNEPQNRRPHGYPGTDMPAWQESKVIEALGPQLAAAKLTTKILAYDHNWGEHPDDLAATPSDEHADDNAYARNVLASSASKWIAGTAYHCYYGDPGAMSVMHAAHPTKDIYFTECSGVQSANPATTFNDSLRFGARNLIIGATRNWAKTVIDWNLALDQNGGPHIGGCSTCTGVVTVGAGGVVTNNVEFYTLGHIAKFVQPGASRIASSSFGTAAYNGQLMDVAFRNPDGSTVLIVHNENDNPTTFGVTEDGAGFRYAIPGGALATFVWNGDAGQPSLRPLDPKGWKATASPAAPDDPCCFDSTAAKALDDDASTRWATGTAQQPGMRFSVDFGRAQPLQQVVLDSGADQGDAPRTFDAEVSTDGRTWTRVVKDGSGQRQMTPITLAGKPVRYLRVTLTGQTGSWWSVADVRAYVAGP